MLKGSKPNAAKMNAAKPNAAKMSAAKMYAAKMNTSKNEITEYKPRQRASVRKEENQDE